MSANLVPEKQLRPAPGLWKGIKSIILASWLNLLLVFIPVSWALHFVLPSTSQNDTLIFVFSFLSIIPLAKLLAFATDELSMRVGQTLAGLLNATLGNAVELIVAIIALVKCELQIVQSSPFHFAAGAQIADPLEGREILSVSHGAAIILLFIYGSYLVFQLFSHKALYSDTSDDVFKSTKYAHKTKFFKNRLTTEPEQISEATATTSTHMNGDGDADVEAAVPEAAEETPQMSVALTIGLLAVVTVLVAVTAEWLVDSINGLTESGHISREFVGLILLPIVGNAAEHVTAVTVSVKDKLTLSLGVAVGSSIQIALFVIPFIVTLGWIIGKPLTLLFDPFESIVLFLSVLVVNYVVQDGKSNWLEGMILMCLYVIIAVTFWYYPGVNISQQLANC
ncbi:Vacuolar calcium ion transporter [Grifola frondosa]|uniref:Vacuolar calcium ion transporter n=1 Tax=Grifola frondosa TaxID=5627 RepID=A0A1C7M6M7_GRIFR|nr:Vacuolar calcium ion transporter [Grifola frondosa]